MTVNARWQSRRPRYRAVAPVTSYMFLNGEIWRHRSDSSVAGTRAIEIRYVNDSSGAGTTALSPGVHRHILFLGGFLMVCIEQFDIKGPPKQVNRQTRLPPDASQLDLPWNKKNKHHNPSFNDTNLYGSLNAVLWIRFILIRIRIRGSVSDDYGSGSESWPYLDKNSKFRNFLTFFLKEKFCG